MLMVRNDWWDVLELVMCNVTGTHMALEGGEVNVRDEEDRLRLVVVQLLEDGHIVAFLEDGTFDIHNWEENTKQK